MLKSILPVGIKKILIKKIIEYRNPTVKLGKKVSCDLTTIFEGHNYINSNCSVLKSSVGRGTYISGNTHLRYAKIGRYCSIGQNVRNGFGIHPSRGFVSTHPAFFSVKQQAGFTFVDKNLFDEHKFVDQDKRYYVKIGNDVWIGNDVMIFDGIEIGDGSIIAAGAIVTKNIAPYSIVGGIPARIIRTRFTEEQIRKLLQIKWWNFEFDIIKEKINLFSDIDKFIESFK